MKFYDRSYEIKRLQEIRERTKQNAQFTIVTGRRRIGKTSLVLKAYEDTSLLYFFVSRKAEAELCNDYQKEIEDKLGIKLLGKEQQFANIFDYIMQLSKKQSITLFIDEFQDFIRVNPSIFGEMQRIWDINKNEAKINLIVCGSYNRLMNKIFKDEKEPLFGRQTEEMRIQPFAPSVLKQIMEENAPNYSKEDLLALYAFTGGVAKYIEHFVDNNALSKDSMLNLICRRDSLYITEGKNTLIEEFGKEYGMYFSILSAMASGYTQRSQIEDLVGKEVGGYLTKLEDEYNLIRKKQPLFEKTSTRNVRYMLFDSFFIFWFRFLYKYNYMIEIGSFEKLKQIIERDYEMFSGLSLERYFREKMKESQKYTRIGGWWDRKGENEIDIIAEDEIEQTVEFYEVKRQERRIDLAVLESKKNHFLAATHQYKGYKISCFGLTLEDL